MKVHINIAIFFFRKSQVCSNECSMWLDGRTNDASNTGNILHVISRWPPFAMLFRGKTIIVVNPRAWTISRAYILDVTGLSKRLSDFGPACLMYWFNNDISGNGTIARSLSGAMSNEKSCYESRWISDNNAQMFAEIGHLICSIQFAQEKRNHFIPLYRKMLPGLTGPIRYANVKIFLFIQWNLISPSFSNSDIKKRRERKINQRISKISFFIQFLKPVEL